MLQYKVLDVNPNFDKPTCRRCYIRIFDNSGFCFDCEKREEERARMISEEYKKKELIDSLGRGKELLGLELSELEKLFEERCNEKASERYEHMERHCYRKGFKMKTIKRKRIDVRQLLQEKPFGEIYLVGGEKKRSPYDFFKKVYGRSGQVELAKFYYVTVKDLAGTYWAIPDIPAAKEEPWKFCFPQGFKGKHYSLNKIIFKEEENSLYELGFLT